MLLKGLDSYHSNYRLRSKLQNPTIKTLTHVVQYCITQPILTKHVSDPYSG